MLRLWLAIVVGVGFLVTSGVIASMAGAQPSVDPVSVITGYEMARNRRDLDTALSYFADNAVITQRNTNFSGKDEIRKYLDTVTSRSRFVVVTDRHTSGNIVTWTERSTLQPPEPSTRPGGGTSFYGRTGAPGQTQSPGVTLQNGFAVTVEAVVQDGKIQSLAYVFGTPAARSDPSLDGRAQLPAVIGLVAVLIVLLGAVSIVSMGWRRAASVDSSLRGRLLQDLRGWAAARQ
jgi:hypothetical protein